MESSVWGLGFTVWGLLHGVYGLGCGLVSDFGFGVCGWFRVGVWGFTVPGLGFRVSFSDSEPALVHEL